MPFSRPSRRRGWWRQLNLLRIAGCSLLLGGHSGFRHRLRKGLFGYAAADGGVLLQHSGDAVSSQEREGRE